MKTKMTARDREILKMMSREPSEMKRKMILKKHMEDQDKKSKRIKS